MASSSIDWTQSSVIQIPVQFYTNELPPRWTWCSCVEFAKWYLNRQGEVWGPAGRMKPTSPEPYAGGVVITTEGPGHVAVIKTVVGTELFVIEANYKSCQVTERTLEVDNSIIVGYQ